MYGWIWRTLPGGRGAKCVGALLLATAVVALLMLVVFPAVEPLLPLDDVTVSSGPAEEPVGPSTFGAP